MNRTLQIAIDCADPHRLAAFWAEVLGYEVEDHHEVVEAMLAAGHAEAERDAVERDGRLAWRTAAACRDPDGALPRLLFQQVPEPKATKNRVHLDIGVAAEDGREAEIERLVALGAHRLWDGRQGPHTWVTLADPEGNEFCVA
jgi:hypothetical protein